MTPFSISFMICIISADNLVSSANTSGINSGNSIIGSSIIRSSIIGSSIICSTISGFSVTVIISVSVSCIVVFRVGTPKLTPTA